MQTTIKNLMDDAQCYDTVRELRWPEGRQCPFYDSKRIIRRFFDENVPSRKRYDRLEQWGYLHKTVNHSAGEYARDEDGDGFCDVHMNTMDGFWSLLRSWLRPLR